MRPERDITTLVNMQEAFYTDRPLLATYNTDLTKVTDLMEGEIVELNGHATDEMSMEKYREQEIADIVWFALGVLRQFGRFPTEEYLEGVVGEFGLQTKQEEWAQPQVFDKPAEAMYQDIKLQLETEAHSITTEYRQKHVLLMGKAEREYMVLGLQRIIGLTWAMFALLKVNPYDAVIEKQARNHAKHIAKAYSDTSKDYSAQRKVLNQQWDDIRGNEMFYKVEEPARAVR